MKIQTQAIHFVADAELIELIETRLKKLQQFYNEILDATVFLRLENSGKIKDKIVEVKLKVPREQLIAKSKSKKFEKSLDDTLEALRKQLIKHKEKMNAY